MKKSFGLLLLMTLALSSFAKKSQEEGWEMILHAQEAQISSNQLTLNQVEPNAILFTKGTPRKVRSVTIEGLVSRWDEIFAQSSPNAVLSMTDSTGQYQDKVVILHKPTYSMGSLHFEIKTTGSTSSESGKNATLYVDSLVSVTEQGAHYANPANWFPGI